ncbi:hypothetical protein LOK49_LG15G01717 [Camellia lanceoleosa]|uniref:Uncharacterized protein n=1 Tax=Camellia lanceoleosa TaxID=1840588 RepID=A0ACC0F3Q2_9ERIC|nr:hypothetical protein LOK49_LG15G01717 [Camellia lanceoleosa]
MGEKKGNNEDEKKKNNGGDGIHIRLLINNKERFEGRFEGSFEGVEYMKVDCVDNKLRVKVDLGKPREKKKVDGKPKDKEKKGNNEDEKKNNNGGDGIRIRLLINNKERFEGRFEGSFEGVEYMKVDCVDNKLRVKVDLGKPREKKKVDGKPQKKADEKKPKDKEPPVTTAVIQLD